MAEIKIIVGLGNPGNKYDQTRHNIGFNVINVLADSLKIKVKKKKFGALFGQENLSDKNLILLKPQSYMNLSGQTVATAVGFYKIPLKNLLVILDDMALDVGTIRIRAKGSAGGHNGLADVIEKLGSKQFCRLRIGIGQSSNENAIDFVLDKPTKEQKQLLDKAINLACQAVTCWLQQGIDEAMNRFNPKNIN